MGKQSQLLLQPTEVELGLQVGVEFDEKELVEHPVLKGPNNFSDRIKSLLSILTLLICLKALNLTTPHGAGQKFHQKSSNAQICLQKSPVTRFSCSRLFVCLIGSLMIWFSDEKEN